MIGISSEGVDLSGRIASAGNRRRLENRDFHGYWSTFSSGFLAGAKK